MHVSTVHGIHIDNRYDPNPILFHRLSSTLLDLYRLFFTFRLRSSPFTGDQLTASSIFCCSAPSQLNSLHHRSSVALLLRGCIIDLLLLCSFSISLNPGIQSL
ncbi:hypothetical protein LXL04_036482 [Taraxacum kok-saghyz]